MSTKIELNLSNNVSIFRHIRLALLSAFLVQLKMTTSHFYGGYSTLVIGFFLLLNKLEGKCHTFFERWTIDKRQTYKELKLYSDWWKRQTCRQVLYFSFCFKLGLEFKDLLFWQCNFSYVNPLRCETEMSRVEVAWLWLST